MNRVCPKCNQSLIEDAWEEIIHNDDGSIIIDAFPAFVCKSGCSEFYEKINEDFIPSVIAQRDEYTFLLLYENNQARILDLKDRILFPQMHVDAILSKGYWEEVYTTIDILEELKSIKVLKEW